MYTTETNKGRWKSLSSADKEILLTVPSLTMNATTNQSERRTRYHVTRQVNGDLHNSSHSKGRTPTTTTIAATRPKRAEGKARVKMTEKDLEWINSIEEAFTRIAGEDGEISYEEFKNAIDVKEELFARKYFKFFDEDDSGTIELREFIGKMESITFQTDEDKLKFLFKLFDENGDGVVTDDELKVVLGACVSESSMKISDEQLNSLVHVLLKAADKDNDGLITFDELCLQFKKYPALIENLAVSPSNWLKLNKTKKKQSITKTWWKATKNAFKNKKSLVFFIILHLLLTIISFTVSAVLYRSSNWCVIIARGCGMALNYNSMAIGLSMARRTLTYIRNTRLGPYLPIDDHVEVHKLMGVMVAVLSFVHTLAHLGNIGIQTSTNQTSLSYSEYLFTTRAGVGWVYASAYITGDILAIVLLLMVLCSLPIVRKSGYFEFFYWTHLLYAGFWLVLLFHGPIFWIWFLIPGCLLLGERTYSMVLHILQKTSQSSYYIEEANLLPSKVTQLIVSRPSSFNFKAGDYVFVRIPSVSRWEWHPFSISSAPEQEGVLWLHIRGLGNWTKRLYNFYSSGDYIHTMEHSSVEDGIIGKLKRLIHKASIDPEVQRVAQNVSRRSTQPNPLSSTTKAYRTISDRRKIYIDGPFGSAAARMGDSNHAVLIAAGIGVTPFASVLQSLLTQHQRAVATAAQAHRGTGEEAGPRYGDSFNLKKIDFVWVNRHANDFEWFITLLTQLEMEENRQGAFDRFLDLHLYMTAAKSSSDLKGVGLQMALELIHQEAKHDLITGLRTRTQAGRPDWRKFLKSIVNEKKGSIHVYFCGSPALAKTIEEECGNFNISFSHSF